MSLKIIMIKTAKEDLRTTSFYIYDQTKNLKTARAFINELLDKCKTLEEFPKRGTLSKDRFLLSLGFRFLAHKEYLIFYYYKAEENSVFITSILNPKRDYARIFKRLL